MRILTVLVFLSLIAFVKAEDIQGSFSVDFVKIETRNAHRDTVKGTIYKFENRMVVRVISPIMQYMIMDSLQTRIYNPGEQAGIELHLKNRSFLPFFQTFFGFLQNIDMVPQLNFRIAESMKKGDSLVTRWAPNDKKISFHGSLEMVYCRDKPVSITSYDKKQKILDQMLFSHDTLINNRHVPLRIVSCSMNQPEKQCEDVFFSNPSLGKPAPPDIRDFKIPPGIPLKVIEW